MIVVWIIMTAVERIKEVRTQGATRYKRKFHFLINAEKNKYISMPKIDKQIEGVFTAWRRQKNGQSQVTEGN